MGRCQRCTAQSADQRMAGAGGQPEPPGEQSPDDGAQQSTENRLERYKLGIHKPLADGSGHCRTPQRPQKIADSRQKNSLPGHQDFRGNNRGNGICRIVKSIDIFEYQRYENHAEDQNHKLLSGSRDSFYRLRCTIGHCRPLTVTYEFFNTI